MRKNELQHLAGTFTIAVAMLMCPSSNDIRAKSGRVILAALISTEAMLGSLRRRSRS